MSYVVYVNYPNNKAIVHSTDCNRYINRKRNRTVSGYWSEPFENRRDALNYAKETKRAKKDTCSFCIRD